jgi:hypothetical protein
MMLCTSEGTLRRIYQHDSAETRKAALEEFNDPVKRQAFHRLVHNDSDPSDRKRKRDKPFSGRKTKGAATAETAEASS